MCHKAGCYGAVARPTGRKAEAFLCAPVEDIWWSRYLTEQHRVGGRVRVDWGRGRVAIGVGVDGLGPGGDGISSANLCHILFPFPGPIVPI